MPEKLDRAARRKSKALVAPTPIKTKRAAKAKAVETPDQPKKNSLLAILPPKKTKATKAQNEPSKPKNTPHGNKNKKIFIKDEPTSDLDAEMENLGNSDSDYGAPSSKSRSGQKRLRNTKKAVYKDEYATSEVETSTSDDESPLKKAKLKGQLDIQQTSNGGAHGKARSRVPAEGDIDDINSDAACEEESDESLLYQSVAQGGEYDEEEYETKDDSAEWVGRK